ncbi:hypothetical protein [Nocardiopsis dassonvillei]|uniref:hypothetical protein n=1 Tax=Nocardiopsis dassonvillei TaxID=2014 RepID=UPI0036382E51
MIINNTDHQTRHPWPHDVHLQGSTRGVVFSDDGDYTTAFVEAFPEAGGFLRGEGADLAAAEDIAWAKYLVWRDCDGNGEHGPWEARGYTNGSGHCSRCGTWMSDVLPKKPDDPDREPGLLERALTGTVEAVVEVMDAITDLGRS